MPEIPGDEALIARCREHDEEAWRLLVERYSPYVYTIATQAFGLSGDEAGEALQETLLRVFEGLPGYRAEGPFRAWLRQVVLNVCAARLRRRRPTEPLSEGLADATQEETLERIEQAYVLSQALRDLGEDCQRVITLFFFEAQPYKAIAARLAIPEGTVGSRMARCLTQLRTRIQRWR